MKTDWSNQDIARLKYLIDENGKANGIHKFAKETGRTENSIRIKLSRINKEKIIMDAENEAYKELEEEQENEKSLSWFLKLVNAFHKIW